MKAVLLLALLASVRATSFHASVFSKHKHRTLYSGNGTTSDDTDTYAAESDIWPDDTRVCSSHTTTQGGETCDDLVENSSTMLIADLLRVNTGLDCSSALPADLELCTELSDPDLGPDEDDEEENSLQKRGSARVVTYPAPSDETPSADYSITVNGQPVFCYGSFQYWPGSDVTIVGRPASPVTFCYFDFKGKVNVNVQLLNGLSKAGINVKSITARPSHFNLKPKVSRSSFSVSFSKAGQYTFEPNGGLEHPLHIFANPLETNIPGAGQKNVIYFGPGSHDLQPTNLDDNAIVYIAGGAVVNLQPVGSSDVIQTVQVYDEQVDSIPPMLQAKWAKNISIRGRGILCGRQALANANQRGNMINLEGVTKGKIDGIILRESGSWTINLPNSNRITVNNVKIVGHYVNNDGIVVGSSNVLVQNSFAHNADDGFQIKSWEGNPVTSVVFRNNIIWSTVGGAFVIPCETYADISGVTWQNSVVLHSVDPNTSIIKPSVGLNPQGPGTVKNIKFKNIVVEHSIADFPVRVNNNQEVVGSHDVRGPVRHISFSNITVLACNNCGTILEGLSSKSNILKVDLKSVKLLNKRLSARHIRQNGFVTGVSVSN